jgi:hypothetical protein
MANTTIVVDTVTLEFMNMWPSDLASPPTVMGPNPQVALETSEDPQYLMATRDAEGNIQLTTDPAKLAQKTADQWTSVRAQQRDLLYKSDWTCSVTDYEVPNKADWVTYRQALRDVTRGSAPSGTEGSLAQSDPFAIVWPTRPSP